jgi:hypothetical protein
MHEWEVPIHSNLQEMAHMLEVEPHTRVPWGEHMVVEHPLLNLLWMLEKKRTLFKNYVFNRTENVSVIIPVERYYFWT